MTEALICLTLAFLAGVNVDSIRLNSRRARKIALLVGLFLGITMAGVCFTNILQAAQYFLMGVCCPLMALFIRAELDLKPQMKQCGCQQDNAAED